MQMSNELNTTFITIHAIRGIKALGNGFSKLLALKRREFIWA